MDGSALLTVSRFVAQDKSLWHAKKHREWMTRYAWQARAEYLEWRSVSDDPRALAEHYSERWAISKQAKRDLAALRARLAEPVH